MTLRAIFSHTVIDERSRKVFSILLPYICFVLYSIGGASIILAIDSRSTHNVTGVTCISNKGFEGALFYISTVYTTIGYGTLLACGVWGKVATIFLAILGIPLFLVVLDSLGKNACHAMKLVFILFQKCHWNRYSYKSLYPCQFQHKDDDQQEKFIRVPLTVVLVIDVLWIIICAVYFHNVEGWNYFEALYFTLISLFTIGFGDFAPTKLQLIPFSFGILIIGLGLVSTTINMIFINIEILISKLNHDIEQEYQQKLEAEQPHLATQENDETPEEIISRLIEENGATYLASLINASQFAQLSTLVSLRNGQHSSSVQTDDNKYKRSLPIFSKELILQTSPLKPLHSLTVPPNNFAKNAATEVDNDRCNNQSQTIVVLTADAGMQAITKQLTLAPTNVIEIAPCILQNAFAQTVQHGSDNALVTHEHAFTETDNCSWLSVKDVAVDAHPSLRTVLLQTPTWGHRLSSQFTKT